MATDATEDTQPKNITENEDSNNQDSNNKE